MGDNTTPSDRDARKSRADITTNGQVLSAVGGDGFEYKPIAGADGSLQVAEGVRNQP